MLKLLHSQLNDMDKFIKSFNKSELGKNYFFTNDIIKETFNEFYNKNTILTIILKNEIIGFICYTRNGAFHSFPYLHLLTIIPEYRGLGYGKQILKIFENEYLNNESKLFLVVADFNLKAKAFYENNEYIQVDKIPNLYKPDISENLMMKIINNK